MSAHRIRRPRPGRGRPPPGCRRGRAGRGGVWCSTPWRPVGHRRRGRSGRRRSRPPRRRGRPRASPRRTPFVGPTGRCCRPGPTTGPATCPAPGWPQVPPPHRPRPGAGAWRPPRCRRPTRSPGSRWSARTGRRTGGPGHRSTSRRSLGRRPRAGRGTASSHRRSGIGRSLSRSRPTPRAEPQVRSPVRPPRARGRP
jgi:hypothetical protein